MHLEQLEIWQHDHDFTPDTRREERRTRAVVLLTFVTMIVEIAAGLAFGSMALLADGWHMGTHVAALGISVFAYRYARRHMDNPAFSFGTGKVSVLGGFASAMALAVVALFMAGESIHRLVAPVTIRFNEAIFVAVLGLAVNVISAFILRGHHSHVHHGDGAAHQHHDYNLKAAYLHVLADALTSVLAIVALLSGKTFGWIWMDPIMGVVGAVIISRWSYLLIRETSTVLLDSTAHPEMVASIRATIEADGDNRVSDLHVWQVSSHKLAAIVSLVTHFPESPSYYKNLLEKIDNLAHVTVEVNECNEESSPR